MSFCLLTILLHTWHQALSASGLAIYPPFPCTEPLREEKGYKNLVDMPCWAHLLNRLGQVIFDGKLLPELHEFMRLVRLLFCRYAFGEVHVSLVNSLRSPFWRTQWVKYQKHAAECREKQMEQAKKENKNLHFPELPPVSSIVRGSETRYLHFDEFFFATTHPLQVGQPIRRS